MGAGFNLGEYKRRLLATLLAAIFLIVHSLLPMRILLPAGFLEIEICGVHGLETILVDRDMNRITPDQVRNQGGAHCALCTLVFGLFLAIALTIGLANLAASAACRSTDQWRLRRIAFLRSFSRAPPLFA